MTPFCYEYPRPAVATDIILFVKYPLNNLVLLIKRKNNPFEDMWALPGGFIDMNETLNETAHRELLEETGINISPLKFFGIYDNPHRDPRGRTIAIVYYSILNEIIEPQSGDDATQAKWFSIQQLPDLAFDHKQIITDFTRIINT